MGRLRNLAWTFHEVATNNVEEPDVPAVVDGDDGYDKSTKIELLLLKEEINKPLRELENYLNEMLGILDVLGIEKSPHYTSFSKWDGEYPMRELRRLLRASAKQAGLSGTASIDASGFKRDQASSHYRNRVGYSFNAMKTTLLVDTESLAIMDAHFTTKKAYDGHIGLQVFRRNAGDLQTLLADKMYSWADLREACRTALTRPVIKHCEHWCSNKAGSVNSPGFGSKSAGSNSRIRVHHSRLETSNPLRILLTVLTEHECSRLQQIRVLGGTHSSSPANRTTPVVCIPKRYDRLR